MHFIGKSTIFNTQRKTKGDYYLDSEVLRLFEIIKGHKIELVILLTAFYGLRRSEVIGLKWNAFDFKHDCVSIRHTVTICNVKGERLTIKKDKAKNKSSLRTYPLIPFLKERLLEAREQQEENRKLCGRAYNKENLGYVCVDVIGNLIKPNYVSSTFGKLLEKHNMRHIRFHDLRHTCASLLLANGVPMEQVKEWLGHSEISTTVDIYGYVVKVAEPEQYDRQIYAIYTRFLDSMDDTVSQTAAMSLFYFSIQRKNYEMAQKCVDKIPKNSVNPKQMQALLFQAQGKREEAYKPFRTAVNLEVRL